MKKVFIYSFIIGTLCVVAAGSWYYYTHRPHPPDNNKIVDANKDIQKGLSIRIDYEDYSDSERPSDITADKAYSGKYSCRMTSSEEYGTCLNMPMNRLSNADDIGKIVVAAMTLSGDKGGAEWVLEISDESGKIIFWQSSPFQETDTSWKKSKISFNIDTHITGGKTLKIYPWNKSRKLIFVDDVIIQFSNEPEENLHANNYDPSYLSIDFESKEFDNINGITQEKSHSGKRSVKFLQDQTYGPQLCKEIKNIFDDTLKQVEASAWLFFEKEKHNCSMVVEVKDEHGKQKFWAEKNIKKNLLKKNEWNKLNAFFSFPSEVYRKFVPSDDVCIYFWNREDGELYADDFEVVYGIGKQREGLNPNIDMQAVPGKTYAADRFHPPFIPINFACQNKNTGINILLPANSNTMQLFPDDHLLSANISGDNLDEILRINEKTFDLYSYSKSINAFVSKTFNTTDEMNLNKMKLVCCDIDGDGMSEVVGCDEGSSNIYVWSFRNYSGSAPRLITSIPLMVKSLSFISSGYFSGLSHSELLIAEKGSGKYYIIDLSDINHIHNKQGVLPFEHANYSITNVVSGNFDDSINDELVITTTSSKAVGFHLLKYNPEKNVFTEVPSSKNISSLLGPRSTLIKGNFDSDSGDEILLFNKESRFDLKLIDNDASGMFVRGRIEFTNFPGNQNPKYYEFPKAIAGNFTGNPMSSLMFILRNCDDDDFDGNKCNNYSDIPYLPNTVQFYTPLN